MERRFDVERRKTFTANTRYHLRTFAYTAYAHLPIYRTYCAGTDIDVPTRYVLPARS